jgi:hypothetical protein
MATAMLLSSCSHEPTAHKQESGTDALISTKHETPDNPLGIETDHGKKWKVDAAMMAHIQKMEEGLRSFSGSSLPEFKTLAQQTNGHLNELTSFCTMSGRAHDELHKWLVPFLDLATDFEKAENETAAASKLTAIKKQMEVFHQYFE